MPIRVSTARAICRQQSRSATGIAGRPPGFPDPLFWNGINFTLSCGVIADSIENTAFSGIAGIVISQRIGKEFFFKQYPV
jgi:hypothetical protein